MKILSDELRQALLDVLLAWREVNADKYSAQKLHDEFPALDDRLEVLDRVSSSDGTNAAR